MAAVLGVSANYHDAAAALVVDGAIVCAQSEERLSRIKNDSEVPFRAIAACLARGGMTAADLDAVVFYENPYAKLERVLVSNLRAFPRAWRQFPRAVGSQLAGKVWVLDHIAEGIGVDRSRVSFVGHHRSHAASAFFTSPFAESAVVVVDAVGEESSTSIWRGVDRDLQPADDIPFPHSLGLLYAALTAYLGFAVNEGEYKVMGLAAYGTPRYRDEFARIVALGSDGSYELDLKYFAHMSDHELGFGRKLEQLLGPRRAIGAPWDLDQDRDRHFADVAATLQQVTEEALLGVVRRARSLTGATSLCLAGGVALNAVANARIAAESGFDRIFVHPAAGDAGGALGAALCGALDRGDPRPSPFSTCALGVDVDAAKGAQIAAELGLSVQRCADPPATVGQLIARGKIVALATGRCEWGPRALGQRSIVASPGDPATRDRINRAIKNREWFRPFAPAVLEREAATWFDGAPDLMTPFMTTVCAVKDRQRLAAVTHRDGSARVQTVAAHHAPTFCAVLEAVERETGIPVVLNTSLNGPGEPIAGASADALGFFLRHGVDALVIDDLLVERR